MPRIAVDMERCTGCRTCVQTCVYAHEGVFGTARARIRVLRGDILSFAAHVCEHCEDAPCMEVCPVDALTWRRNRVVFDPDACTGCGECAAVCPNLFWDEERRQPLICDLCGACLKRCPEQAIRVVKD